MTNKLREFLYRGKRKDNGKWIESPTVFSPDNYVYMYQSVMCELTYDLQYNITAMQSRNSFFVEVIPETVSRFIGLTDRNGRKIFEGDIVKWSDGIYVTIEYIQEYSRFAGVNGYSIFGLEDTVREKRIEVVGNIYDNPELLKEVKPI